MQAPAVNAPRRIEIVAKRFTYSPAEINLKKGEPVVLVLHSDDVTHGLKFDELNVQAEVGKNAPVDLPLLRPKQAICRPLLTFLRRRPRRHDFDFACDGVTLVRQLIAKPDTEFLRSDAGLQG